MQTLYYTTNNFIRHTDNIVDLSEYRRKLERMQEARLQWQEREEADEEGSVELRPRPRCSATRRERRAALLDLWASMGILVMTLTFTVHVLCL